MNIYVYVYLCEEHSPGLGPDPAHWTLDSAPGQSGDQNWVTVSRMMKQFAEPGRPHDWINQKTCAAQYNLLEERCDIKRPKRGEKIEAGESPMELIVKKLSQERIDELGIFYM